jgi:2-haloalkanoic acid dehalogenase type II
LILAFDLYGTLFSTQIPGVPREVMDSWRRKQLEYTWRSTLMGEWRDFDEITRMSLWYVREKFNLQMGDEVLEEWRRLKPFPDVEALQNLEAELWVLTNGVERTVNQILRDAGLIHLFKGVFSAERVREYKPSTKLYKTFQGEVGEGILISSNPFDVAGAKRSGMKAVFVRRGEFTLADFMGLEPDSTVDSLWEIQRKLIG